MSEKIIRSIYEARLAAWASAHSPVLKVAYENVRFTPPTDGSTYLRCFTLPAKTDSQDLQGVHEAFQGVFQINIVAKIDVGLGEAKGIADELLALYPNNLRLTKSGLTVQSISPCSQGPAQQDTNTATVPVWFNYRADVI